MIAPFTNGYFGVVQKLIVYASLIRKISARVSEIRWTAPPCCRSLTYYKYDIIYCWQPFQVYQTMPTATIYMHPWTIQWRWVATRTVYIDKLSILLI